MHIERRQYPAFTEAARLLAEEVLVLFDVGDNSDN
jgi:hypothetical protein